MGVGIGSQKIGGRWDTAPVPLNIQRVSDPRGSIQARLSHTGVTVLPPQIWSTTPRSKEADPSPSIPKFLTPAYIGLRGRSRIYEMEG